MKKIIFGIIIFLFIVFLYALYIDTSGVKIKEYSYESSAIPKGFDGFKIVHFSDILIKDNDDINHLEQVVEKINNLSPDVIIFSGDLVYNKLKFNEEQRSLVIKLLKKLEANLYKYAIYGDNDNEDVKAIFEESNFKFLDNSSEYLFNESVEPIVIAGGNEITDEMYYFDDNLPYNFAITITHKPDNFDNINTLINNNLVISGHSLGGQIRLPFLGGILKKDGAKKYTDDYYQKGQNTMYVSYGIGTEKGPFRLLNKSSINVYRLYSK